MIKIIISPAKKMNTEDNLVESTGIPVFESESQQLLRRLKAMSSQELQQLWKCNTKIAQLNDQRIRNMKLNRAVTPALLAYQGIQYQYMAPKVFTNGQWDYVQQHLRILSGFYGVLKPLDRVVPYRLEMQAQLETHKTSNLYEYWGNKLYQELTKEGDLIINLASKEYSQTIEKYLQADDQCITCVFGEYIDGKVKIKATQAKMARGEMVRWMSEHQIQDAEQIKDFSQLDYRYNQEYSDNNKFVFLKH